MAVYTARNHNTHGEPGAARTEQDLLMPCVATRLEAETRGRGRKKFNRLYWHRILNSSYCIGSKDGEGWHDNLEDTC